MKTDAGEVEHWQKEVDLMRREADAIKLKSMHCKKMLETFKVHIHADIN